MSQPAIAYRTALRELRLASARSAKSPVLRAHFRAIFESYRATGDNTVVKKDVKNAITYMRAQRKHKILTDLYNPLFDLTAEKRIQATVQRVGFQMPTMYNADEPVPV